MLLMSISGLFSPHVHEDTFILVLVREFRLLGKKCSPDRFITQTRPCNIQQYVTAVKNHFQMKFFNIFLFFPKTLIVGTR